MRAVFACNQYVDEQAPWALRKTDPDRMAAVLYTLFGCIRHLAIAIQPIVPAAATKLLDQLGIAQEERSYAALDDMDWYPTILAAGITLSQPNPIFPRLELDSEV